jgi:hypothetical protein
VNDFITKTEGVYVAVRVETLNTIQSNLSVIEDFMGLTL